nr:MAG TPA: hypothetical protein [Caudoviricetes sp.]
MNVLRLIATTPSRQTRRRTDQKLAGSDIVDLAVAPKRASDPTDTDRRVATQLGDLECQPLGLGCLLDLLDHCLVIHDRSLAPT